MKQRAFTLAETVVGLSLFLVVLMASLAMITSGLKSFQRNTVDMTNATPEAQAIRRIQENVRSAMTISITNNGNTLTYTLPAKSATTDPITGEVEYKTPMVSDGTNRSYTVSNGKLVQQPGGRTLLKNITLIDPDPTSSTYNQTYQPFTLLTMSTRRGVTINLVTSQKTVPKTRYARMKTSVVLQNIR